MDKKTLAGMLDHTYLKPDATYEQLQTFCEEAHKLQVAMVAINSAPVTFCKNILKDSNVHVGAAISFPLGQTPLAVKVFETKQAIEDGADEIDYVVNLGDVKMQRWDLVQEEMQQITSICKKHHVISKVIFENCYLSKEEITKLAEIACVVLPDFIKTSTGFGPSGALVEDVALMKQIVKDKVKIKAAGGIRDWNTCKAMIDAGAQRIGTSSSLKILEEFTKTNESI